MSWKKTFKTRKEAESVRDRLNAEASNPLYSAPVNLRYRVKGRTVVEDHYNRKPFT